MKKAEFSDMELGNMMFGNSLGEYCVEPRKAYQNIFCDFLLKNGWGGHAIFGDGACEYENDTFLIRPYYWGEDEEIAELPNFVYKPTGLEIRWYKYPMRDAYSNQDVSVAEFAQILAKCEQSMRENDHEAD